MLKSKNKTIAGAKSLINLQNNNANNHVGADDSVRPNSRGITLIALIITIIVMLILVAVTINVVLDTGLFGIAKEAGNKTKVEADREILQGAVVASVNENLQIPNATTLQQNLPEGWNVTGTDGGPYTVTSSNGNIFTVDSKGNIAAEGEELPDQDLDLLERYFLGEDKTGKDFMSVAELGDGPTDVTFKDDENTPEDETELASNIHMLNYAFPEYEVEGETEFGIYDFYIKYNNKAYAVRVKINSQTNEILTTSVEYKYTPQGLEGEDLEKVTGNPEHKGWTILYDYGNGTVEAVAPTAMGELTLGAGDTTINWENETVKAEADIEGIGTTGQLEDIEKAIYSYNNAIETINKYCETLEGLPTNEGVRSVGAKEDPIKDITTPGNTITKNDILGYNEETDHWFDVYDGKGKASDTEYEQDFVRMSYYGVANINVYYWSASRLVYAIPGEVLFGVGYVRSGGYLRFYNNLWYVYPEDSGTSSPSLAVRPVITVSGI